MDVNINMDNWNNQNKPFGISGCFRLRDEEEFMVQSIKSHLPFLDEAVLVVQPSKDSTKKLAEKLVDTYPDKVRLFYYDLDVRFIDHPLWHQTPEVDPLSFVYLSNWALSQCKYSWICKAEGDVIALDTLSLIRKEIEKEPKKPTYYGRMLLNIAGKHGNQISYTNPRNAGWDECVVPNTPSFHFFYNKKWESMVGDEPHDKICMGWSCLHLKRCKKEHLPVWNNEKYIERSLDGLRVALSEYNKKSGYIGRDGLDLGAEFLVRKSIYEVYSE